MGTTPPGSDQLRRAEYSTHDPAEELLFPPALGLEGGLPKFLNSGCVVGRAAAMRHMLAYALGQARPVRDDQQILVRYAHEHPHLVAVDVQVSYVNIIVIYNFVPPFSRDRNPHLCLSILIHYC